MPEKVLDSVYLRYRKGASDKHYMIGIVATTDLMYQVVAAWGKCDRSVAVRSSVKKVCGTVNTARALYNKLLKEKLAKGYETTQRPSWSTLPAWMTTPAGTVVDTPQYRASKAKAKVRKKVKKMDQLAKERRAVAPWSF